VLPEIFSVRYDGNPLRARKGQFLSFEKDERLEILDQSDSEWWEVHTCNKCVCLFVCLFVCLSL